MISRSELFGCVDCVFEVAKRKSGVWGLQVIGSILDLYSMIDQSVMSLLSENYDISDEVY